MIEEIKHLVQLLGKVEIKHSSMDQNRVAHELAQLGSRAVSNRSLAGLGFVPPLSLSFSSLIAFIL